MSASKMIVNTDLKKVVVIKFKVRKNGKLIMGVANRKNIDFEKICSFIEKEILLFNAGYSN